MNEILTQEQVGQSRHLALKVWLNCKAGSEFDQEIAARIITEAMTQSDAAVRQQLAERDARIAEHDGIKTRLEIRIQELMSDLIDARQLATENTLRKP
jgi:hypothetical protein